MVKYFVISDVHSFYDEMMAALRSAGFRKNNPDHILILCGDLFDRGPDSVKVYNFIRSIPKHRRILIRGNHELLLRDTIRRGWPGSHDYSNGTVSTIRQFYLDPKIKGVIEREYYEYFKQLPVLQWLFSDEWVNYYELGRFVFVHSWIPVNFRTFEGAHYNGKYCSFRSEWRDATDFEWEAAMWGCPWKMFLAKMNPPDKTLVCGHWHASDFHTHLGERTDGFNDFSIYYTKELIALDACTAQTGFCNVLVIDGEKCYDQYGRELEF